MTETLRTTHLDPIAIRCQRCGRAGRYRRATLVERFGAETRLPDVLWKVMRESGCPQAEATVYERCKLVFAGLER